MKNLTELQSELRRMSKDLAELERQVEDLKPKDQTFDMAANYPAIRDLSRKEPIKNPTLMGLDGSRQGQYLRLLCTAAALDGPMSAEQLIYLCRLSEGAGHEAGPQDLAVMAYQTDYLDWQAAACDLEEAALPLVLDLLLAVHLAGRTPDQGLAFAAELAALLEVENRDMEVCAQLAAALLSQDLAAFQAIGAKRSYSELGYAVPVQWLEKARVKCQRYIMSGTKPAEMKPGAQALYSPLFRTLFQSGPDIKIVANEVISDGHNADVGCVLVNFCAAFVPPRGPDGRDLSFDKNIYILPEPAPICAPRSGIVRYSTPVTGEREVWITSPFDQL